MLIPFVLKLSLCIFSIMLLFTFGLKASLSNFSFDRQLLIGLAICCNYFSFWYQFLNVRFVLLYFFHLGQSCYWIFRLFKCFFFLVLYTYVVIISLEIFFLLPHYSRHPKKLNHLFAIYNGIIAIFLMENITSQDNICKQKFYTRWYLL